MSTFSDIRRRARRLARRETDDGLGPDRGTMDQEQARIERAKQEARREARQERTRQRVQSAREAERERVLNGQDEQGLLGSITSTVADATAAVADGDGERVDDVRRAMSTDFDGDGQPLADELGLQSSARADAEDRKLGAVEDLANDNAERIGVVENDIQSLDPSAPRSRRSSGRDAPQQPQQGAPDLDFAPDEFDPEFDDFGGGGL